MDDVDALLAKQFSGGGAGAVGAFASMGMAVAERLRKQGIGVTVIDPRWVLPVSDVVAELAVEHKLVVTIEDNGVRGGVGSAVSAALRRAEIDVPLGPTADTATTFVPAK